MGWYKGKYVFSQRSLSKWFDASKHKKDNYFRIRNRDQADVNVVKFVYSPNVVKNRRLYSPCTTVYKHYLEYCDQQGITPLGNRQFKKNMQLLGFVYQKHHRFYAGYYQNKLTTAYRNIGIRSQTKNK